MNNALQKIRPVESPVTLIVPFILAFEPFLRRSLYRSWSSRLLFHCSWRFYSSAVCACVTPWLCVTYESACVCVCGLRAAIDRRRVGPIEENKNYGEARAGGRCVNSTQLCRLVRHNYHAEQIDGQYRISVSIDNTSTSMLGLLCR